MSQSTRRGFVQQSAALGIGLGLGTGLSGSVFAANDKISVACVGVRGRGNSVMQSFANEPDCEITHICDVRQAVREQRGAEMKQRTGRMPKPSWKAYDAAGKLVKQGSSDVGQQAHIRNFLDSVRSRKRESLNQEIYSGHVSTVMCHAGNICWRTGKKLRLDAKTETFDDQEANQFVGREHRKGFELPEIS